jgi:tetratricopeptide (TPR) repeat protein
MRARSLVGWSTAAFGLILLASSSLGCAQHATIRLQRPALVSIPIRRVAIIELQPQREEGRHAVEALWTRLQQSGRFELVPQGHLQRFMTTPLFLSNGAADQQAAIEAGRQLGVDALLIVNVQFLETDGTVYGSKTIRIGEPEVVAAVQYELIDVRSGQILDKNVMSSQPYKGDLTAQPPGRNAESEVLSQLAYAGGAKVSHLLLPHEDEFSVELAHSALGPGSSEVRQGMAEAQAGNWVEARQYWLAAVEANPQNDAATYNLALSHEALGEFTLARRALAAAAGDNPNSLTKEALARVDRAAAEMRLAQSRGRIPRSGYFP